MREMHDEKDKIFAPFLLAASFQGIVKFGGSSSKNGVLYWRFYPKSNVTSLIQQFQTRTEPRIPAVDLFSAISSWWQEVANIKKNSR